MPRSATRSDHVRGPIAVFCSPAVVPFTGLKVPEGVAVDGAGAVYVIDGSNNRVVMLSLR
jgi:hypothetical protein